MDISKPSIIRLARRSGVKTISDDCYDKIRDIINKKLEDIISKSITINSQKGTKTLMSHDLYLALSLSRETLTQSNNLGK